MKDQFDWLIKAQPISVTIAQSGQERNAIAEHHTGSNIGRLSLSECLTSDFWVSIGGAIFVPCWPSHARCNASASSPAPSLYTAQSDMLESRRLGGGKVIVDREPSLLLTLLT